MSRKTIKSISQNRGGLRPESIEQRDARRGNSKLLAELDTPSNREQLIALYESKSQAEIQSLEFACGRIISKSSAAEINKFLSSKFITTADEFSGYSINKFRNACTNSGNSSIVRSIFDFIEGLMFPVVLKDFTVEVTQIGTISRFEGIIHQNEDCVMLLNDTESGKSFVLAVVSGFLVDVALPEYFVDSGGVATPKYGRGIAGMLTRKLDKLALLAFTGAASIAKEKTIENFLSTLIASYCFTLDGRHYSNETFKIDRSVIAIDCWQRKPGFDRVYNRGEEAAEFCLEDCLMSIEDMELKSGCIIFAPLKKFRDTQVSVILSYDKRNDGDGDITHMILELTLQLDLRS